MQCLPCVWFASVCEVVGRSLGAKHVSIVSFNKPTQHVMFHLGLNNVDVFCLALGKGTLRKPKVERILFNRILDP